METTRQYKRLYVVLYNVYIIYSLKLKKKIEQNPIGDQTSNSRARDIATRISWLHNDYLERWITRKNSRNIRYTQRNHCWKKIQTGLDFKNNLQHEFKDFQAKLMLAVNKMIITKMNTPTIAMQQSMQLTIANIMKHPSTTTFQLTWCQSRSLNMIPTHQP